MEPVDLKYLPNVNPFTEDVINQVPQSTAADVNNAVQCAVNAFPAWSVLSRETRAEYLRRIALEIESRLEVFCDIVEVSIVSDIICEC